MILHAGLMQAKSDILSSLGLPPRLGRVVSELVERRIQWHYIRRLRRLDSSGAILPACDTELPDGLRASAETMSLSGEDGTDESKPMGSWLLSSVR